MFSFKRKISNHRRSSTSQGLWQRCVKCSSIFYNKEWEEAFRVCPICGYHYPLSAHERIQLISDTGSFEEKYKDIAPVDFLNFEFLDTSYAQKIKEDQAKTGLKDAIITGKATIETIAINLAVMEFQFMGGSMGSVVGEKFALMALDSLKNKIPYVVVTTSGGARMQEGLTSLMQMAKTSAVVGKLNEAEIPYIVIITDPTYGGITASFGMLGDITLAEPGARCGFAGARVIEQTIKQKLPEGFQSAEFLLDHGFIDMIVERKSMKRTLAKILSYLTDA
jgi:acetyl-CoA carboxylase carboxyl transferase subunit beta